MKMTRKIVSAIKAGCREACGGRRKVEVGNRHWPGNEDTPLRYGMNMLLWGDGHDLDDLEKADDLVGQDIPDSEGWVALDCYCYNLAYFGREPDDALDCNVYLLINPAGEVAYASEDDLGHAEAIDRILKVAGHPGYIPAESR